MKTNLLLILTIPLLMWSCKKFDAGTGGKATIHVKVINGSQNVPEAPVKVIYNARQFPGSDANYDNEITADHTGLASFENLRRGDYYFYSYITSTDSAGNETLKEGGSYGRIASKYGELHLVIDFAETDPF